MAQIVGLRQSQIHPWEHLLKEVFESFEADTIEDIITNFREYTDDNDEGISSDDDMEDDNDKGFDLQKRFYHALNKGRSNIKLLL